jgi:hypothetical protein
MSLAKASPFEKEIARGLHDLASGDIQGAGGAVGGESSDALKGAEAGDSVEMAEPPPLFRHMIPQKGAPFKTDAGFFPSKTVPGQPAAPIILLVAQEARRPRHPGEESGALFFPGLEDGPKPVAQEEGLVVGGVCPKAEAARAQVGQKFLLANGEERSDQPGGDRRLGGGPARGGRHAGQPGGSRAPEQVNKDGFRLVVQGVRRGHNRAMEPTGDPGQGLIAEPSGGVFQAALSPPRQGRRRGAANGPRQSPPGAFPLDETRVRPGGGAAQAVVHMAHGNEAARFPPPAVGQV